MRANESPVLSLRRLALLLGAIVGALYLAVYVQATYLFSEPSAPSEVEGDATGPDLPELPGVADRLPANPGSATVSLFVPSATPVLPAAQVVAPEPELPSDTIIILTAVIVKPDERRALLEVGSDRKIVAAREGTLAEGWRVVEIRTEQVTLERGAARRVVYFSDAALEGR